MKALGIDPAKVEEGRWIFSAWKHLRTYQAAQAARFEATSLAGKSADLLGRLRGLEGYSMRQVGPLARDAAIPRHELRALLIPTMESARVLQVDRDAAGRIRSLRALVLSEDDVMDRVARLWEGFDPDPPERAALIAVREAARLPRTQDEIAGACVSAGLDESDALQGIELASAHALVRKITVPDFDAEFLYNDFLWGDNIRKTSVALAALPTSVRESLTSLLDELHRHEGRPLKSIESASADLVQLAVVHGLIERTEIVTQGGARGTFHFTPRFRGFGIDREEVPDALDQVRLVIASFGFAAHYARFRLRAPEVFLESLIENGVAGNATPIGTDYGALEKQKIVEVEPVASGSRFHRFVAVKKDSLVVALDAMRAGTFLKSTGSSNSGRGLLQPREFSDPVETRLRLGEQAGRTPEYDQQLLAAVRDAAQQDRFAR